MPALANVFDERYLTELSFKELVVGLINLRTFISSDHEDHIHPCLLVKVVQNAERYPGTGIFRQTVELELQVKLDETNAEEASALVGRLQQCFYRNDTDPRPQVDLANRLTKAQASPYTCLGIVRLEDPAIIPDSSIRVYSYKMNFRVECTPTR